MTREEHISRVANRNPKLLTCTFAILHANEFCIELFLDAKSMIMKTSLYRYGVKKYINEAEKHRRTYERNLNGSITYQNSEFLADSNDKMDKELSRLEMVFYYQIKQELDRQNVEYSAEIAKLEECHILLSASLIAHDEALDEIFKTGIGNINREYLRLTAMKVAVRNAMSKLSHGKTIDLDTTVITTAYNNLIGTLFSARIINKTIEE